MDCTTRWLPVYDFDDLQVQIKTLINDNIEDSFYNNHLNHSEFY